MTMSPGLAKLVLTAHVTFSVGWLGAVAVFLALGFVGLTSQDPQLVRGVYLVMEPAAWSVLVPLSFGSLVTGLIQSLGTRWGLFQHYWILFKLLINVVATIFLLIYTQTLSFFAEVAQEPSSGGDLSVLQSPSVVIHAGVALLLLLVATTLSVYKPRGLTRYGQRKQHEIRAQPPRALSQR